VGTTLSVLRDRVRANINEARARRSALNAVEIDQGLRNAYLALQSRLPPAHVYTASAFTIAAGADTFTLPTAASAEYAGEVRIQIQSDGSFLCPLSAAQLDAVRAGIVGTDGQGRPTHFTLWEDNSQVVQGRCYPRSKDLETCNLWRGLVAADFTTTALDSTTIELGRYGIEALIYAASAELVAKMPDDELALRKLNSGVVGFWLKQMETTLYRETCRRHELESAGTAWRY